MSDDKTLRSRQDADRINLSEDDEVCYWANRFSVWEERLSVAVEKVGVSVDAIAAAQWLDRILGVRSGLLCGLEIR